MTNPSPAPRKDVYFTADQLMLVVEHPTLLNQEDILVTIRSALASLSPDLANAVRLARVLNFSHGDRNQDTPQNCDSDRCYLPSNQSGQAHFITDDPDRQATQDSFSLVLFDLSMPADKPPDEHRVQIITWIEQLNVQLQDKRELDHNLVIRGASPNWLSVPSPDNGGGSGPGGRPIQAPDAQTEQDYRFALQNLISLDGAAAGGEVDVAILDSAPSDVQLNLARETWPNHLLLPGLLGQLNVHHADPLGIELPLLDEVRVKHHDYVMTDHGIFAAGIIHSIAPKARLHLIEVLNAYGVGTLWSIAQGLHWLAEQRKQQAPQMGQQTPLLINCSLMLVTPLLGHSNKDLESIWPQRFKIPKKMDQFEFKVLTLGLEWICASLRSANVLIVASAGNDGDDPDAKHNREQEGIPAKDREHGPGEAKYWVQARYPAAYTTVLGVGALLEDTTKPADYSNLADRPQGTGIATFGGGKDQNSGEAEKDHGVLGVFIGKFPVPKPGSATAASGAPLEYDYFVNNAGWAWWAGTSFAAPLITGTVAALISPGGNLAAAERALNAAVNAPPADSIGGLFPAKQGS